MDALDEILQSLRGGVMPATRGVLSGATAGLSKPIAAGMMMGMDYLTSGFKSAPKQRITYQQALDELNAQQAADREAAPIASYGGEIAGSLIPAGMAAKVATSIPKAVLTNAALGGLSGYNERQDYGDAAIGAGVGGALGAAGGVVRRGQEAFNKFGLKSSKTAQVENANNLLQANVNKIAQLDLGIAAEKAAGRSTTTLEAARRKAINQNKGYASSVVQSQEILQNLPTMAPEAIQKAAGGSRFTAPGSVLRRAGTDLVQGSVGGGLLGAAAGAATGQDPFTSGLYGLGAGAGLNVLRGGPAAGAVNPIIRAKAGLASKVPLTLAPRAAGALTPAVTGQASRMRADQEAADLAEEDALFEAGRTQTAPAGDDLDALFEAGRVK